MIPEEVETIIMTKKDYDRNVEQLLLEKIELQQRIDRTIEELKLWQPEIKALKMEKNYLLDILEGKDETNN